MNTKARCWLAGLALAVMAVGLYQAGHGTAGEDAAIRDGIMKIAAALEKGDTDTAKSEAQALAKKVEDIEDVMNVFKLRAKKGFGVGKKGAVQPDGIEMQLNKISRDAPGQATVNKHGEAFRKMAYQIAAVAEVAVHKPPKDAPAAKKKLWVGWAKDLREAAPGLVEAAKQKSPAAVQKAAAKINNACNSCHSEFK